LQVAATTNTYLHAEAASDVAKALFVSVSPAESDKAITATKQGTRAKAQVNRWFQGWVATALDEDWKLTGKDDSATGGTNMADEKAAGTDTWRTRTIGAAEALQTNAVAATAAATKNKDAATRWKTLAGEEAQAAAADVVRARTLLTDLVAEIAPLARAEAAAQADVDKAKAEQAARDLATEELGDNAVTGPPAVAATGARAVLAAATATKNSIDEQQAFHDQRADWAADALKVPAAKLMAMKARQSELNDMVDKAEARFDDAREACKRAGFEAAQEAREKAQLVAAAKDAKIAEVKKEYDAKATFPEDGSPGTLCRYPKKAADAAQEPRAECLEGEPGKPLCCGAAQRFLKDGTKLSVETCQLTTATTYKYYPALAVDALVAPTPETWRFQCISGAQKLAAAAAAALTAGYMMA